MLVVRALTAVLSFVYVLSIAVQDSGLEDSTQRNTDSNSSRICSPAYYGQNCRHHCHCRETKECARDSNADIVCISGCDDGWNGPSCQSQNLAFGMPARIRTRDPETVANYAVDGNASSCVTSEADVPGWLRVDLKKIATVYYVTIITDGFSPRGWQLYVTDYSDFFWSTPCATVRTDDVHVLMSCDTPTTGRHLALLNVDGPVGVCEVQVSACADYSFGAECVSVCQCADASEVCHPLTGQCVSGCMAGFTGQNCQQGCHGNYGNNCATPCGQCKDGALCHPVTGECPEICQAGWSGANCDIPCETGTYGENCQFTCGHCLDDAVCDPVTGHCPGLCLAGWHSPQCNEVCQPGTYGYSCQFLCGQCLPNTTCDITTGICPQGCDSGREGLFCTQECLPHNYGLNCRLRCDHCLVSCDSKSGVCDASGCQAGWKGDHCNIACTGGDFGENCKTLCGHCLDGAVCDAVTGQCPQQDPLCEPGWDGPYCLQPCTPGLWGLNCSKPCGSCERGAPCDSVTGFCPGPCSDQYSGERCDTKQEFEDVTDSRIPLTLMAAILSVVLTVMAVVLVCLGLKWSREKHLVDP